MIRLVSKNLDAEIGQRLASLQLRVDAEADFKKQVDKAQSLWNSKGGKKGKEAFEKIKQELYGMTVSEGLCNYCEQSEANDIEHIDPKSFFPQRAFIWENYLLACKQCNSGLKLDKCHVLDANDDLVEVVRGTKPPFSRVAFINPRIEDPNLLMILNLQSFKFELMPGLTAVDKNRIDSTLNILELNGRDPLIEARKAATRYYFLNLDRIVRITKCRTKRQLQNLLSPGDSRLDFTQTLKKLKADLKESHRLHISRYQHPSVWHSIKVVERQVNPIWKNLFDSLPEALNW